MGCCLGSCDRLSMMFIEVGVGESGAKWWCDMKAEHAEHAEAFRSIK